MTLDIRLPYGPIREALETFIGAAIGAAIVSMVGGGALKVGVYWDDLSLSDGLVWLLLAWASDWIVACILVWGFIPLLFHCAWLHALFTQSRDPIFALALLFTNQVIVSTLATAWVDPDVRMRALLIGVIVLTITVPIHILLIKGGAHREQI
jgi:hypothetical protein